MQRVTYRLLFPPSALPFGCKHVSKLKNILKLLYGQNISLKIQIDFYLKIIKRIFFRYKSGYTHISKETQKKLCSDLNNFTDLYVFHIENVKPHRRGFSRYGLEIPLTSRSWINNLTFIKETSTGSESFLRASVAKSDRVVTESVYSFFILSSSSARAYC